MSLILEALKKSEQQRRLGEAPTLGSPVLAVRRRRSLLPLFGTLIVIAIAAGWWLLRPRADRSACAHRDGGKRRHGDADADAADEPDQANAGAYRANPAGGRTTRTSEADGLGTGSGRATAADRAADHRPSPAASRQLPLPPAATSRGAACCRRRTPNPRRRRPRRRPAAARGEAACHSDRRACIGCHRCAAVHACGNGAHRNRAAVDLGPALRNAQGSARPDPDHARLRAPIRTQRFVVIKGERHIEGDELGGGVILREIRADGMVLDYKGTRFVYPRDGG